MESNFFSMSKEVVEKILNSMDSLIYITDIDTDAIIFISDEAKRVFSIDGSEGKCCWQILTKHSTRCNGCPVTRLKEIGKENVPYIWEEYNDLSHRIYENHDRLIRWIDGRLVHIQHSFDITKYRKLSEAVNTDELTGLYNRRAGKEALRITLEKVRQDNSFLTVGLFDLNDLKHINDEYGHHQGDRSIKLIATAVLDKLKDEIYVFRLSGDEFVAIFDGMTEAEAEDWMIQLQRRITELKMQYALPFDVSFCYGLVQIAGDNNYSLADIITFADERMYTRKKSHRILKNQQRLWSPIDEYQQAINDFDFEKEHLLEAISNSIDDILFIGNMKTGTFRYSKRMQEEFDMPGPIVPNAAAVWGRLIHPEDKQYFLEENQEIADGRTSSHNIIYRARNRQGQWVRMRCRGTLIKDKYDMPDLFAGIISEVNSIEE